MTCAHTQTQLFPPRVGVGAIAALKGNLVNLPHRSIKWPPPPLKRRGVKRQPRSRVAAVSERREWSCCPNYAPGLMHYLPNATYIDRAGYE